MAGAAKKWFIGCGIGCGLFLLIIGGIGTVSYLGIKQAVDHGEDIEAGFEELRAEYGAPSDFVPEPDGAVPSDRMEVFLAARDAMAADRKVAGDILRTLDGQDVDGKTPNFIDKAKAGIQLIPSMMTFIDQRNQALLNQGMGLGEYLYIYTLSYYVLLDRDLADGPGFNVSGEEENSDGFRWETGEGKSGDTRVNREKQIRRYLHSIHLAMARNQLQAIENRGAPAELRQQLEAEMALMRDEPLRLLWETGMPSAMQLSLEMYRDQLEASYDEMVNVLESGLIEHE
jgi:hypothetical protein